MPTLPMRSSTTSCHHIPTATYTYSPSVPLSVYRELAAELKAAEARLDSLSIQNQQLARHNQQLRQEIGKAVQSVLRLQRLVDYYPSGPVSRRSMHRTRPPKVGKSVVEVSFPFSTSRSGSVFSKKVFTEKEEGRYRRRSRPETAAEVSGWSLAIAILLIMVTAFGIGYLIVRPLVQNR